MNTTPQISLTSVLVEDQEKALSFYTEVLGFEKKTDIPLGEFRWLTVTSPAGVEGLELLLEPNAYPPAKVFQEALVRDGITATVFFVQDLAATHQHLESKGVVFTVPPTGSGPDAFAIFDDTCGNLIRLHQK